MPSDYDVVVVGAGIAGLSAAIYTSRHGLRTLVVGKDLGGQLILAGVLENFPGNPYAKGVDLIMRAEQQARSFGSEITFDEVVRIDRSPEGRFLIETAGGDSYVAHSVILAVGKSPKDLGVPGEVKFKGRGVSYCAICDAPFFRGKDVALVSWGELAREPLGILLQVVGKLYWILPGDKPLEDDRLLERALSSGRVVLLPRHQVVEIRGEKTVGSLLVKDLRSGEQKEVRVSGVFVEIGFTIKTDFVKHLVDLNERGEIVADWLGRTKTPGLFAAGDVVAYPYKQAVIAAAMGAAAGLSAVNYVMELKGLGRRVFHDWMKVREEGEGSGKFKAEL